MGVEQIRGELNTLAAVPGVRACALVESGSGLVWCSSGEDFEASLWEAASEYWRLHRRIHAHFDRLGSLHVAALHHSAGMLVLMPCAEDPPLVVACVAAHRGVDWRGWQRRLADLGRTVRSQ